MRPERIAVEIVRDVERMRKIVVELMDNSVWFEFERQAGQYCVQYPLEVDLVKRIAELK